MMDYSSYDKFLIISPIFREYCITPFKEEAEDIKNILNEYHKTDTFSAVYITNLELANATIDDKLEVSTGLVLKLRHQENIKSNSQDKEKNTTLEVEGKKYDGNKPMTGTILRVFPYALNAIGACIKFGATKYPDPNNWKKNKNALVRYNDSLVRHLTKHFTGNELDEETKLPHLAHVAWNALAILELYLMENPEKAKELMYPQEIRNE